MNTVSKASNAFEAFSRTHRLAFVGTAQLFLMRQWVKLKWSKTIIETSIYVSHPLNPQPFLSEHPNHTLEPHTSTASKSTTPNSKFYERKASNYLSCQLQVTRLQWCQVKIKKLLDLPAKKLSTYQCISNCFR